MNVGPCASTGSSPAAMPAATSPLARARPPATGIRRSAPCRRTSRPAIPRRARPRTAPRCCRTRWRSRRRRAARRARRRPRAAPAGSPGRGSACRPRPARPAPRSPRPARPRARSISPRSSSAYASSTPAANPAGGSPANTCRGSTPSHIRCMPPSGSHTDIAMNVSPWYPPRQVSSRFLAGQPARPPVLQAHLDRDLDADRARVAQEHVLEPVRGERRQPVGQGHGRLVRQPAEHHVAHPAQLVAWRRRRAPGARTRGCAAHHDDMPSISSRAVRQPQPHAAGSGDDQRRMRARHRRVRMPDPLPVQLKQLFLGSMERIIPNVRGWLSAAYPRLAAGFAACRALAALLAQPHGHLDRGAREAEVLAEPALDEPAVGLLEEPGREQHEVRRLGARLGGEQDPRLLAAAHRRRGGGDRAFSQALSWPVEIRCSQPPRACSIAGTSRSTCRPVAAEMFTRGAQRDVVELALDLPLQVVRGAPRRSGPTCCRR